MASGDLLLPGQPITTTHDAAPGEGTYAREGYVMSSLIGRRSSGQERQAQVQGTQLPLALPQTGSTVIGRVTRVNPRQANVSILVVDGLPCGGIQGTAVGAYSNRAAGEGIDGSDFQGIVRAQDVRSTEKDSVVLVDCFRPGDIVRALSLIHI